MEPGMDQPPYGTKDTIPLTLPFGQQHANGQRPLATSQKALENHGRRVHDMHLSASANQGDDGGSQRTSDCAGEPQERGCLEPQRR